MLSALRDWNHARLLRRRAGRGAGEASPATPAGPASSADNLPSPAAEVIDLAYPALRPLRVYTVPKESVRRVSIVTDSINGRSFYGGVGTALILGALFAEQEGARLRVITRTERPDPQNVGHLFEIYGITPTREVEFAFSHFEDRDRPIDVQPDERFITTSWWTTAATMGVIPHESIYYLLQEDERMFYPHGDMRLRCERLMRSRSLRFILNTRLLRSHLLAEGFDNIAERGLHFEPAFPSIVYRPRERESADDRSLFVFYARPKDHERNLFHFGLEVIDKAVKRGLLDQQRWRILFVGKDVPRLLLGDDREPEVLEGLSWKDYAQLLGETDVGLFLMYTPHPSYPPLDLAASGGIAITNRHGLKQSLDDYSRNIVCADLDIEAMLEALERALTLSANRAQRATNFRESNLKRDWHEALSPVLAWMSVGPSRDV
jgi:hypothetical protein